MLHYIIIKWKKTADKSELVTKVRNIYSSANEIIGVKNVCIKENITPRDNRYDIMIVLILDEFKKMWYNKHIIF